MTYNVNGINYNEKMITDEELVVINAMRNGAKVSLVFFDLEKLNEVDDIIEGFNKLDRSTNYIFDRETYIAFNQSYNEFKIDLTCYLKKSHSAGKH